MNCKKHHRECKFLFRSWCCQSTAKHILVGMCCKHWKRDNKSNNSSCISCISESYLDRNMTACLWCHIARRIYTRAGLFIEYLNLLRSPQQGNITSPLDNPNIVTCQMTYHKTSNLKDILKIEKISFRIHGTSR